MYQTVVDRPTVSSWAVMGTGEMSCWSRVAAGTKCLSAVQWKVLERLSRHTLDWCLLSSLHSLCFQGLGGGVVMDAGSELAWVQIPALILNSWVVPGKITELTWASIFSSGKWVLLKEFSDKIHMHMASTELVRVKELPPTAVWQQGADQRPSNLSLHQNHLEGWLKHG